MQFLENERPFAFLYDNKSLSECGFSREVKGDTTIYAFEDGFKVTNIVKKIDEFEAKEWVNWFENTGDSDSRVISDIKDCDVVFPFEIDKAKRKPWGYIPDKNDLCVISMNGMVEAERYWENDAICTSEFMFNYDYLCKLPDGKKSFENRGGRSSDRFMPIFDITVNVVYEIVKFTIGEKGLVEKEMITKNSIKNNSRPYYIPQSNNEGLSVIWMYGDYYDWIVSAKRPLGYNTAIRSSFPLPTQEVNPIKPTDTPSNDFTIFMVMNSPTASYPGVRWDFGDFGYGIDKRTIKPYLFADHSLHLSNNVWGNSDAWKQYQRTTNGKWLAPVIPQQVVLCITYTGNTLRTYINGLLDQSIDIEGIQVSEPQCLDSKDITTQYQFFKRVLGPDEIKQLVQKIKIP